MINFRSQTSKRFTRSWNLTNQRKKWHQVIKPKQRTQTSGMRRWRTTRLGMSHYHGKSRVDDLVSRLTLEEITLQVWTQVYMYFQTLVHISNKFWKFSAPCATLTRDTGYRASNDSYRIFIIFLQMARGGRTAWAPAISRLEINPYPWCTECIRGDVDAGPATAFPQVIGLAATFRWPLFKICLVVRLIWSILWDWSIDWKIFYRMLLKHS